MARQRVMDIATQIVNDEVFSEAPPDSNILEELVLHTQSLQWNSSSSEDERAAAQLAEQLQHKMDEYLSTRAILKALLENVLAMDSPTPSPTPLGDDPDLDQIRQRWENQRVEDPETFHRLNGKMQSLISLIGKRLGLGSKKKKTRPLDAYLSTVQTCPICSSGCPNLKNHLRKMHSFIKLGGIAQRAQIRVHIPERFGNKYARPSQDYLHTLTAEMMQRYEEIKIPETAKHEAKVIKEKLELQLQRTLALEVLMAYGSFYSEFGTKGSDLDFSMSIPDFRGDPHNLFLQVANLLRADAYDITYIGNARVKTVQAKYYGGSSTYDVDITLNNDLPVRNTQLLRVYAQIDSRVRELGLLIKDWAAARKVKDAFNKTLSSYTYVILVIYYLQQIGMLPVLQELVDEPVMVQNYDCRFFEDHKPFHRVAQQYIESVGELYWGFFEFYSSFDWKTEAVDIRFKARQRKPKHDLLFYIQDPFEVDRNLGDVSTQNFQLEILNEFCRAACLLSNQQPLNVIAAPLPS